MRNDREIASDILADAVNGNVDRANNKLSSAIHMKRGAVNRVHSVQYLIILFCIAMLCLGIDALDGHIIDIL